MGLGELRGSEGSGGDGRRSWGGRRRRGRSERREGGGRRRVELRGRTSDFGFHGKRADADFEGGMRWRWKDDLWEASEGVGESEGGKEAGGVEEEKAKDVVREEKKRTREAAEIRSHCPGVLSNEKI